VAEALGHPGEDAADVVASFIAELGMPHRLADVGIGADQFSKIATTAMHDKWLHCNPVKITSPEQVLKILEAAAAVNSEQASLFVDKIRKHFRGELGNKRIGVWGLAFKPRTNDMRDAPSVKIIEGLLAEGATVIAYDPEAMDEAKKIFDGRIQLVGSNYGCVEGADALLIVTEWQAFRNPNFERMKGMMRQPVIFDGRNIYDPIPLRQLGFTYYSVGR